MRLCCVVSTDLQVGTSVLSFLLRTPHPLFPRLLCSLHVHLPYLHHLARSYALHFCWNVFVLILLTSKELFGTKVLHFQLHFTSPRLSAELVGSFFFRNIDILHHHLALDELAIAAINAPTRLDTPQTKRTCQFLIFRTRQKEFDAHPPE